jgi:hypothetical protein
MDPFPSEASGGQPLYVVGVGEMESREFFLAITNGVTAELL